MRWGFVFLGVILLAVIVSAVNVNVEGDAITGKPLQYFGMNLTVITPLTIAIISPQNTTYSSNISLLLNYTVSGGAERVWYSLDGTTNITVTSPLYFSTSIGSHTLYLYANNSMGEVSANVTFFINISATAPFFGSINSSMFLCENTTLSYFFDVTDLDAQVLQLALTPTDPFYLDTIFTSGAITTTVQLFSGIINEDDCTSSGKDWKVHNEKIEVTDGYYSDTAYTNITVIRLNDAPVIANIGVQTVWTSGDDSTFYKQVAVTDEESGNQNSGNLSFSISFPGSRLFNITNNGIMNFTPNSSQVGVYSVRVCVNDTGIANPHVNISSLCGQSGNSMTTCQNFSLTVTNQNRAPTITSYYPQDLTPSVSGLDALNFNISKYDPDRTIPDTYWYVDSVFQEYDSGSSIDTFTYSFGCGVSGIKKVKAEITDGLLNDSVEWDVTVALVECPVTVPGGGGGGGGTYCKEKWVCGAWRVCQNTERSLDVGLLSGDDYRLIKDECLEDYWSEEFCGMQTRTCMDMSSCGTTMSKPSQFQSCYYTENPSCYDGIKNCHDESCELLIDCGGPCSSCPSCSDKIQNQGEEGIDCGSPCPWKCPKGKPLLERVEVLYFLIILLLILIIVTIVKVIQIIRRKRKKRYMGAKRKKKKENAPLKTEERKSGRKSKNILVWVFVLLLSAAVIGVGYFSGFFGKIEILPLLVLSFLILLIFILIAVILIKLVKIVRNKANTPANKEKI